MGRVDMDGTGLGEWIWSSRPGGKMAAGSDSTIHDELDCELEQAVRDGLLEERLSVRVHEVGNITSCVEKLFRAPISPYYSDQLEAHRAGERSDWFFAHNYDFPLRFYLPRSMLTVDRIDPLSEERAGTEQQKDATARGSEAEPGTLHLVIMLNGLNESLEHHYRLYDRLGHSFAYHGVASVLLPTPFHLCRTPYLRERDTNGKRIRLTPTQSLLGRDGKPGNPYYLPNNFTQTIYEVTWLRNLVACEFHESANLDDNVDVREPSEEDKRFYRLVFGGRAVIVSVLGYSMGGLKALACFKVRPKDYRACIMLNSGGSLPELRLDLADVTEDDFQKKVVEHLAHEAERPEWDRERRAFRECPHYQVVKDVLFVEREGGLFAQHEARECVPRLIVVAGGRDQLVKPNTIARLQSRDHGLNMLQIADLSHFIADDPQFNRWYSRLTDLLVAFFQDSKEASFSGEACFQQLALLDYCCDGELARHFEARAGDTIGIGPIVEQTLGAETAEKIAEPLSTALLAYCETPGRHARNKKSDVVKGLLRARRRWGSLLGQVARDWVNTPEDKQGATTAQWIEDEALKDWRKTTRPSGMRFGTYLVGKNAISPVDLKKALQRQHELTLDALKSIDASDQVVSLLAQALRARGRELGNRDPADLLVPPADEPPAPEKIA